MAKRPTFVSLFSGCGGLDDGFIKAGFRCLRAFDNDPNAVDIHKRNLGNSAVVLDLLTASEHELAAGGHPDVVVSGSPCQGFSTAGKRDLNDPRNALLLHGGRLAVLLRPKVFVAENVAGALSGAHKTYWDQLESLWRSADYRTTTVRINAQDLGVAQRRARVVLIAWRADCEPKFAALLSSPVSLRQALKGMDKLPQHDKRPLAVGTNGYLIAQKINRGQKLSNVRGGDSAVHTWEIPEVFGRTNAAERAILEILLILRRRDRIRDFGDADPVPLRVLRKEVGSGASSLVSSLIAKKYIRRVDGRIDLVHTFNGKYKRLEWSSASLAVDTKFGDPRYFLHPTEHRGFTVREAARLQGFQDDFVFPELQQRVAFRMIGNAVPPPMGSYLARTVKGLL